MYVCSECGAISPKWIGRCPQCGNWNCYSEEAVTQTKIASRSSFSSNEITTYKLNAIDIEQQPRLDTFNNEFNRVVGGGITPGSVTLVGGEPGIGKSTLMLQIALNVKVKTLYVSGEESAYQLKMRADRLNITQTDNCEILCEVTVENIIACINQIHPGLVIIDSVQTLRTETAESSPGTITQIRESTDILIRCAKTLQLPMILVGHINKEGNLAGPKILEHMVDTVLQFEGDNSHIYRVLRSIKNRFGATGEVGIYEMKQNGLEEVKNPSKFLIHTHQNGTSGVSVASAVEGLRPLMIEVQALVSTAAYGLPQRNSTGFDYKRLNMLLAVLERRAGFRLNTKDVFLNIAGGIKVNDPAMDLAVISAVLAGDLDLPIPSTVCFAGEIGLTGEIRPVSRTEQRIIEAEKLGFKAIFVSASHADKLPENNNIRIIKAEKIDSVFKMLFAKGRNQ